MPGIRPEYLSTQILELELTSLIAETRQAIDLAGAVDIDFIYAMSMFLLSIINFIAG